MNRPEFFIENQSGGENVHDRLSPTLSALVLISHVKEGLVMAEAVGLPPRVREVIEQHHGTTLIKYFYFRATGGLPDPNLEPQFRYPGPRPQSKEAAILMLADTVEAASRTLDKPTPARIADFVARIVEDKRADGQLDECDLTLRDLQIVQEVFARTLSGTLHARIEYPGQSGQSGNGSRRSSGAEIILNNTERENVVLERENSFFHRHADDADLDDVDVSGNLSLLPPLPASFLAISSENPENLPCDPDRHSDEAEPEPPVAPVGTRGAGGAKTPRRGRR